MAQKECYFLGIEGSDTLLIHKGIHWLMKNAKISGGWIAVLTNENILNISKHDGLSDLAVFYERNTSQSIIDGVYLNMITKSTIPGDGLNTPLLAIHPSEDFLDYLDVIPNISKMLVIPWTAREVDKWAEKNKADDYDSPMLETEPPKINNTIAEAMRKLDQEYKRHDDLSPESFRHPLITALLKLKINGENLDPKSLRAWLVLELRWRPVSAKQASEIAQTIQLDQIPMGYTQG